MEGTRMESVGDIMSLMKSFANKKREIGFWNTVKLALKFIYSTNVRGIEEIKYLKYYASQYEIEHREVYNNCKENGKLVERVCPICGSDESVFFTYNTTGGGV